MWIIWRYSRRCGLAIGISEQIASEHLRQGLGAAGLWILRRRIHRSTTSNQGTNCDRQTNCRIRATAKINQGSHTAGRSWKKLRIMLLWLRNIASNYTVLMRVLPSLMWRIKIIQPGHSSLLEAAQSESESTQSESESESESESADELSALDELAALKSADDGKKPRGPTRNCRSRLILESSFSTGNGSRKSRSYFRISAPSALRELAKLV